jgi:hypothetical protein
MVAMDRAQAPRDWDAQALRRLEAERRALLPAGRLAERTAWRDRRLMALAAHKRAADKSDEA